MQIDQAAVHVPGPAIRHIGYEDLRLALSGGIQDFSAYPTFAIFLALIYPVVGLFIASFIVGSAALHLLYPAITGFALLGPFAAIGTYEISRAREEGRPVSWRHAFDFLRSNSVGSIALLGLVLLIIFVAWVTAANLIFQRTLGDAPVTSLGELLGQLSTRHGAELIVVGNVVGFGFALVAFAVSVISFPMLIDKNVSAAVAITTSVRAVLANPVTMLSWGFFVAGALAIGALPFFLGLAVVIPILGHATWHLYRRIVPH